MATFTTPNKIAYRETISAGRINTEWVENVKALYDRLVHEVAQGYSANAWTPSNSAGTWEDDTSGLTVSLTLEKVSNVIVYALATWYCSTAQTEAMKFRIKNQSDTTYSDSIGLIGEPIANTRIRTRTVGHFANVAAGAKVFRLQGSRATSGITVTVTSRRLLAVAYSVA